MTALAMMAVLVLAAAPGAMGLFAQGPKLVASDGAKDDGFGVSVAIDGDRLVVGAWYDDDKGSDSGSAYVFERNAAGVWAQAQKLLASDGAAGDAFGSSVAMSGGRLVIGAPLDGDKGPYSGSAYVFERNAAGTWTQTQKLLASDGTTYDQFGISVAISGDHVVIGAWPSRATPGSAYVFERSAAGTWTQAQKLLASDGAANDGFGFSVVISGDRILIGAIRDRDRGLESGSAYVFERSATGIWTQAQKLLASDGASYDWFGASVAISGDRLVIGAIFDDDRGPDSGSAYVFERSATGIWTQAQKLLASDGAANDGFGVSVAISGDRLVIGAPYDADRGPESGSAYVFARDAAGTWTQTQKLLAIDGASPDSFGISVAMSGGRIVIGAPFDYAKGGKGSAYVFRVCGPEVPGAPFVPEVVCDVVDALPL